MKSYTILSTVLAGCVVFTGGISTALAQVDSGMNNVVDKAANARVPFIKNQGQINNNNVNFYAKLFAGTLFVTRDNELVYSLTGQAFQHDEKPSTHSRWSFREKFVNAKSSYPKGSEPSSIKVSHFKGNKPGAWDSNLSVFDRIDLGEVYNGIRVELQASGNNVEKLFYVKPSANVADIKIAIDGVQSKSINQAGQLVLTSGREEIAFTTPIAYQEIEGRRHLVDVKYALTDKHYGFTLGKFDPAYAVVIDPLLASTYIGGVNANPPQYNNYDHDIAYSIIVVGDSVYIGGVTQSTDFPIVLGYDDTANASGWPDGFIARFSNDLSTLYSSTYFGTENFDRVAAIALDTDGTIVATGQAGYGFPVTTGAYNYQGSEPVGGGFVAKFSADLSSLIASAVVTPSDYPTVLTVGNGSIYFGGRTDVPGFPVTEGAFLSTCCRIIGSYGFRDHDGFAGKISSDLSTLEAMTYLGGDGLTSLAVAPDSSLYMTDAFSSGITGSISHMDADLTSRFALVKLYPGTTSGSSRHYFYDVAIGDGFVVTVGQTYLNDMPVTPGAFDASCGSDGDCDNSSDTLYLPIADGFIAKYSLDLQTVLASTYLGGSSSEALTSVALDSEGNVIVVGGTSSSDMPTTTNAHDSHCGSGGNCNDVYIAKLNNDLSQLLYGSYLGGSEGDTAYDLAVAPDNTAFISGSTSSADFPVTGGAFDTSYAGGNVGASASGASVKDAFVSQFDLSGDGGSGGSSGGGGGGNIDPIASAGADQVVGPKQTVTLNGSQSSDSDGVIVQYQWTQVSGRNVSISNSNSAIASFNSPGVRRGKTKTLVFELTVTDNQGATATDQVSISVTR